MLTNNAFGSCKSLKVIALLYFSPLSLESIVLAFMTTNSPHIFHLNLFPWHTLYKRACCASMEGAIFNPILFSLSEHVANGRRVRKNAGLPIFAENASQSKPGTAKRMCSRHNKSETHLVRHKYLIPLLLLIMYRPLKPFSIQNLFY